MVGFIMGVHSKFGSVQLCVEGNEVDVGIGIIWGVLKVR
jgi:hypothetical protein